MTNAPFSRASLSITSIPVHDQDRTKRFYEEALGFVTEMDEPMQPPTRWVMLRPAGGGPAISLVTWFESMPAGSLRGNMLDVEDIEAAADALRSYGALAPDVTIASEAWGRYVMIADPDGNGWIVREPVRN